MQKHYKVGQNFLDDIINLLKVHGVKISPDDIDLGYAIGELVYLVGKNELEWTTNISESLSCGYGKCDFNGFFEFPVSPKLVEARKKLSEQRVSAKEKK